MLRHVTRPIAMSRSGFRHRREVTEKFDTIASFKERIRVLDIIFNNTEMAMRSKIKLSKVAQNESWTV